MSFRSLGPASKILDPDPNIMYLDPQNCLLVVKDWAL